MGILRRQWRPDYRHHADTTDNNQPAQIFLIPNSLILSLIHIFPIKFSRFLILFPKILTIFQFIHTLSNRFHCPSVPAHSVLTAGEDYVTPYMYTLLPKFNFLIFRIGL